ncbi:MAG: hypothetical protein JST40_02290 [Armatimonadetes bacterium]|nr:hypothetical protein [Armatimonadota bacterium]
MPPFARKHLPWIFVLFVALVPFMGRLANGEVLGPWDQISTMIPGAEPVATERPWDVLQADACLQFYPWRDLVFSSWREFKIPFWNPYQFGGTPLLANSQSAGLYPPHILAGILHLSTPVAMNLLAALHLFIAGWGVSRLAMALGAGKWSATVGGALFASSPFMFAWASLPSVISTVAWIPWVLLAVTRMFQPDSGLRPAAWGSICVGMMVFAGHLQFAFYGFLAAGILAVVEAVRTRRWMGLAKCAAAVAIGLGIAFVQLKPVLEYSQESHRRAPASAEGYKAYLGGALSSQEYPGLLNPNLYGDPRSKIDVLPFKDVMGFWPMYTRPGANFAENAVGLSGPILGGLLLWLGLRKQRMAKTAGIGVIGIVGVLGAMGTPILSVLYFGVPGFSATGSPSRMGVLWVLASAVLAGLGYGPLRRRLNHAGAKQRLAIGLGIALVVVAMGIRQVGEFGLSVGFGLVPILLMALFIGALLLKRPLRVPSLLALGVAWAGISSSTLVFGTPPRSSVQTNGERVAFFNNRWNLYAIPHATMPGNLASLYRVQDIAGYDSLVSKSVVEHLSAIDRGSPTPPENGNMMLVKLDADENQLIDAGVTKVYERTAQGVEERSLPGLPLAQPNQGNATFKIVDLNTIQIQHSGATELIVRERFRPGWSATAGGKPVTIEKHGIWLLVSGIPTGSNQITLRYSPPGFSTYLGVSAVCLLLAAVGLKVK